ncbi:MAG: MotA/TolQ/ExbB proton channel family protein [Planctomycetota bacterium]|jgi:biopolymer transport protein ExbB|nr:MotA/TolQ/ExbB proton channel family protein [Planctomycetota bacterium]
MGVEQGGLAELLAILEALSPERAGPLIYVLVPDAVLGLAYVIYCFLVLRRGALLSRPLSEMAEADHADGNFEPALAVCRREGGPFAEILALVITTRSLARSEAEAIVEGVGRRAMHDLSRGTLVLEVVSGASTLLGLLGTVLGMFKMMMGIRDSGIKDISVITGGIGEALITTIVGLAIAIPAYVAFVFFSRRVEDLVLMMEEYAIQFMTRIRQPSSGKDPA